MWYPLSGLHTMWLDGQQRKIAIGIDIEVKWKCTNSRVKIVAHDDAHFIHTCTENIRKLNLRFSDIGILI